MIQFAKVSPEYHEKKDYLQLSPPMLTLFDEYHHPKKYKAEAISRKFTIVSAL